MSLATDDQGFPRMRLAAGDKVVAVFIRTEPGKWKEVIGHSKAQQRFRERRERERELRDIPPRERSLPERGDHAHMRGNHLVPYVGRRRWGPWHPDWSFDVAPHELPGYREIYDFGHNFRMQPDKLYRLLDQVWAAGRTKVQLDLLRKAASEQM